MRNEDRSYVVIESKTSGEKFLLPFPYVRKNHPSIPEGFIKRTSTIPLPMEFWNTVKDLSVYSN